MLKKLNEDDIVFFNEKITIVDVNDIQNRKENLSKYSFYKVEFKKYILNSYINVIFLIIILPINSFFGILLFLILKIYIPKIKFHPTFKFKFINSFKYH
ncbi:hypothetical protein [Spiroplasma endosymbiont of Atherix ibis]|uniref:hypothetical protein n=1 Tax=Spiroplasma endosymbiont of Atherix ibis TaxID=3066291 RepID=UPI0030D5DF9D